jgi:hypothetical protein
MRGRGERAGAERGDRVLKDIDKLKQESADELRSARDRREERDARAQRDLPILGAYERMSRGEPVPYTPGPTHPATRVVNIRRDAAAVAKATAAGEYVYIGRPSKWGNPFTHLARSLADHVVPKDQVLPRYEAWLRQQPELMASLHELRGQVLGCWCKPAACHGDILARLADGAVR